LFSILSSAEREQIGGFSVFEFGSIFQVGVFRVNNPVSSLSLRERVRVRGLPLTHLTFRD
jgi:hypothetical protein